MPLSPKQELLENSNIKRTSGRGFLSLTPQEKESAKKTKLEKKIKKKEKKEKILEKQKELLKKEKEKYQKKLNSIGNHFEENKIPIQAQSIIPQEQNIQPLFQGQPESQPENIPSQNQSNLHRFFKSSVPKMYVKLII